MAGGTSVKVILLTDDEYNMLMAKLTFTIAMKGICPLSIVHDARQLLEEADLEDPSTILYIDMAHSQAEYVRQELYHRGITRKLIVMVICRSDNLNEDSMVSHRMGIRLAFKTGIDIQQNIINFIMKMRDERGLS
jgi:hypothetical protein